MFRSNIIIQQVAPVMKLFQRSKGTLAMRGDVNLSSRRVMKKIKLGKSRPTIFHQFETLVELSDGSVIKRRSQAPKDEIRMINDQRNSSLWNPNRSDIVSVDPNATGKINKFKQRLSAFNNNNETNEISKTTSPTKSDSDGKVAEHDAFIELMGHNVQEVASGGSVLDKKAGGKKKK